MLADETRYTLLYMVGDYASTVAASETVIVTPPNFDFQPQATNDPALVSFFVRNAPLTKWWSISLAAPAGQTLAPGSYYEAQRTSFRQPGHPGIDIGGSCGSTYGEFHVLELERGADGAPTVFAADFAQYCYSSPIPGFLMSGSIRYNSTIGWRAFSFVTNNVDFGPAVVGTTSPIRRVNVSSQGVLPSSFTATIEGTNASDFSIIDDNGCLAGLAPGQACQIGVVFTASGMGDRSAWLRLRLDPLQAAHAVQLLGGGRQASQTAASIDTAGAYPGPVTVRINVTPGNPYGSALGEVLGLPYGSATINAGVGLADFTLPPGLLDFVAHFLGNDTLAESFSAPIPLTVPVQTQTFLQIGPDDGHMQFGDQLHLYAWVECAGSYDVTGGSLTIRDSATGETLASQGFVPGQTLEARADRRLFPPSLYYGIEASFSGDSRCAASSTAADIEVDRIPTTTVLTLPEHAYYPQGVTLIADVSPVPDGGVVEFYNGIYGLGTAPVSPATGRATLTLNLTPGTRYISARFLNAIGYATSTTEREDLRVQIETHVAMTADPESVNEGVPTTITGTVSAIGAGNPQSGQLTMTDVTTGAFIASVDVTSTSRQIHQTLSLSQGVHVIEVAYGESGDYAASVGTVTVDVGPPSADRVAPAGAVQVNGGSTYTNNPAVALTLSATDPAPGTGVKQMQLSATQGSWPTGWQTYANSLQWNLGSPDGPKQVYVRFKDGAGNISATASAGIVLDTQSPTQPPPDQSLIAGSQVGSTVPVRVAFGASDPTSGVATTKLDQSTNGGSTYTSVPLSGQPTAITRSLSPGSKVYRFRARAADRAGNQTPWAQGDPFSIVLTQDGAPAVRYVGAWTKKSATKASGQSYHQAASSGAVASFSFVGSEAAIVARLSSASGRAAIYADGVQVGIIDLYSATTKWRRVAFAVSFGSSSTHRLEVRVLGTKQTKSTGTRVGLDAFVVIK